jgi:hypothetical protein
MGVAKCWLRVQIHIYNGYIVSYVFHIDDSGTKDYADSASEYGSGPTRYFVFGGVLATLDVASVLAQKIANLKERATGGAELELKSNWLRMPHERKKRYLEEGIDDRTLTDLVDEVYRAVDDADVMLIAAVVDKVQMVEEYGTRAYYPPAVAYEALMQRVQNEVVSADACLVVVDDMTGKNPKGNEHKRNLIRHHELLRKHGSRLRRGMRLDALGQLKFMSSARSNMLQVADLVAYNVYRQFVEFGEDWEKPSAALPTYGYFARLERRFRADSRGRIQGYGIIKIPVGTKVRWYKS